MYIYVCVYVYNIYIYIYYICMLECLDNKYMKKTWRIIEEHLSNILRVWTVIASACLLIHHVHPLCRLHSIGLSTEPQPLQLF